MKYKWKTNQIIIITILIIILVLEISLPLLFFKSEKLEYLKITISLVGPVLTFIVFQNTLGIQKQNEIKNNYENANNDFKYLFALFKEKQKQLTSYIDRHSDRLDTYFLKQNDIDLGDYFRSLSILIDIMNEHFDQNNINETQYERFILILRTQITEMEFKIILRHVLTVPRGIGLGIGLTSSNFFGKEETLNKNNYYGLLARKEIINQFILNKSNLELRKQIEKERDTIDVDYLVYSTNLKGGDK